MFFKFEYSCLVFIFVDRNPTTVAFDCDSFAFSEKTHYHFYDSTLGWTNSVVEILQREVSGARVPEIVLQNDPALFQPNSKLEKIQNALSENKYR